MLRLKSFSGLLILTFSLPPLWAAPAHAERSAPGAKPLPPGTCLSPEEAELAALLQQYRRAHDLPPVPLSKSLSLVARWHAIDLEKNEPARGINDRAEPCNLHSWSDKGPWGALCYTADHREARRLSERPRELTDGVYTGTGQENVYYNAEEVLPFRVVEFWSQRAEERAVLLQSSPWNGGNWPAMGVGVYGHYAVVWFGTSKDPKGPIGPCAPPVTRPEGRR